MTYTENGMLTPAVVAQLRRTSLPKDANILHKLAEAMSFAEVCKDLTLPALVQVAGMNRNISKVAAMAIVHFHTCPN